MIITIHDEHHTGLCIRYSISARSHFTCTERTFWAFTRRTLGQTRTHNMYRTDLRARQYLDAVTLRMELLLHTRLPTDRD